MNLPSLADLARLVRLPVSAAVALPAASAWMVAGGPPEARLAALVASVLALACGASALNQAQERSTDARMARTKDRPLPAGRLGLPAALAVSVLLLTAGLLALARLFGVMTLALGCAAVAWYNLVYTKAKRMTPYAAIPGAAVGALVPAIGWAASGAPLSDPRLAALCFFFWIWQVPHFWLLAARDGDEVASAGLPAATRSLRQTQIGRIAAAWLSATAASGALLPLFSAMRSPAALLLLALLTVALFASALRLLLRPGDGTRRASAFAHLNGYCGSVSLLLCADRFV